MSEHPKPRFQMGLLEQELALEAPPLYRKTVEEVQKLLRDEPGKLEQIRYSSLGGDYFCLATALYELGFGLNEIRDAVQSALDAQIEMYLRRGTEDAFPAYQVRVDLSYPPDDPRATDGLKPIHPPGTKDFSLTNSHKGYLDTCWALCIHDFVRAERIAALIFDPEDADYIGPRSFCTRGDQRVAYALRDLFANEIEAALATLKKLSLTKYDRDNKHQAEMIRGMLIDDEDLFLENLEELLLWFRKRARRKDHSRLGPFETTLCVPALGLSVLAVKRGVTQIGNLPEADVYYPLELPELNEHETQ